MAFKTNAVCFPYVLSVFFSQEGKKQFDKETEKYYSVLEKHLSLSSRKKETHLHEVSLSLSLDVLPRPMCSVGGALAPCWPPLCSRPTLRWGRTGRCSTMPPCSTFTRSKRSRRGRSLNLWSRWGGRRGGGNTVIRSVHRPLPVSLPWHFLC